MKVVLKLLASLLYYILGNNMYKSLRSEADFVTDLARVWNTIVKLISVRSSDDIVVGINTKSDYLFPDMKLHEVLSFSGLVLFKSYAAKASLKEKYILCTNHFDSFLKSTVAENCFPARFNWVSLFDKSLEDKKKNEAGVVELFENKIVSTEGKKIMTASEWNAFWNNVISKSSKSIALKPLEVKYLSLNEISALINSSDKQPNTDSTVIATNLPSFDKIFLFDDENEYPAEFSIICGINEVNIAPRVVKNLKVSKETIIEDFAIDEYLFTSKTVAQ